MMTVLYTVVAIASLMALLAAPFAILWTWGDHDPGRGDPDAGSGDPSVGPSPPMAEAPALVGVGRA